MSLYYLQINEIMQNVFGSDQPENGTFFIPDVCGEQTNSFFQDIPTTQARCNFEDGGGWTVILRRNANVTEKVSFDRPWADYERGFGDLSTEFWYGLRNMHCLTNQEQVELQIEIRRDDGTGQIWIYGYFEIDGPANNYTLHIGQAQGPRGGSNAIANHNGMPFSTYDRDNDPMNITNCADDLNGGWWFNRCYVSFLTGGHTDRRLNWNGLAYYPYAEVKLRPKRCKPTARSSCN